MNKKSIVLGVFLILLMTIISPVTSISKQSYNTINLDGNGWEYDEDTGIWSIEFLAEPLDESVVIALNQIYVSGVGLIFSHEYFFPQYTDGDKSYFSKGYIEISNDYGKTWEIFDVYENSSEGAVRDLYMVLGTSYRIKFTVEGIGDSFTSESGGFWRIWDIDLVGDTKGEPPKSFISVSSPMIECEWCPFVYQVTIEGRDKVGVKEVHYILNRIENICYGNVAEFVIGKSRKNYLSFWSVDNLGNEEIPHILPFAFKVDRIPPSINIISPELGLYLFGKKIPLQINKTIIIGSFEIEANASDIPSGLYKVTFYLNDKLITELTEEPYKINCNIVNRGPARLKVVAWDYAMNVAEDNLDFVYYNFL